MRRHGLAFACILLAGSILLAGCGGLAAAPSTTTAVPSPSATATTSAATTAAPTTTVTVTATVSPAPTGTAATSNASSPSATTTLTKAPGFTATDPVSVFTAEDLAFLGLDGLTGTPRQIADAIRKWQEDTWNYVSGVPGYEDVSDPIRWNYFLPGVFPSADIVREQVRDGRIYGICYSYATVYCSVANYYVLETRILASLSKPSDSDSSITITTGLSPDEYDRFAPQLASRGGRYDYEAVRLVARETPTHYWAEVKIDGQWVIEDGTQQATGNDTLGTFFDTNDYELYDWTAFDRTAELDGYQAKLDAGERLPESGGPDGGGPAPTGRATNIDQVMSGQALAPWFASAADAHAFVGATGVSAGDLEEDQYIIDEYERRTGRRLYLVAALIAEDGPMGEFAARYEELCGEPLDVAVLLAIGF